MNITSVTPAGLSLGRAVLSRLGRPSQSLRPASPLNTSVLITPETPRIWHFNNDHVSIAQPSTEEVRTPSVPERIRLPEFKHSIEYTNPLANLALITSIGNAGHTRIDQYIDQISREKWLFNKLRNDTKHRKRAFTKRGYFRRTRALNRRYAYALQGIDLEMLEGLEMGELPDLKKLVK